MLEERGMKLDKEVAILDTINNIIVRRTVKSIKRDSLIEMKSWRDSSKLKYIIDNPSKGKYHLTFRYNIDSKSAPRAIYHARLIAEQILAEDSVEVVDHRIMQLRKGAMSTLNLSINIEEVDGDVDRLVIYLAKVDKPVGDTDVTISDLELAFTPTVDDTSRDVQQVGRYKAI